MISRSEMAQLVAGWNAAPDATHDPHARQMIAHEVQRIHRAYDSLPVRVQFVAHDPYTSYEQMRDSVNSSGVMLVWQGASETPLWDPLTNWKARAVHDWDHIVHKLDFSMEGEAAAYRKSAQRSPELERLYLSEIMLQAAVQNYTGNFAPQKLVLASPELMRAAGQMRGLGEADLLQRQRRGSNDRIHQVITSADAVWFAAGLLKYLPPAELMLHLRAMGYSLPEALVITDAAQMLRSQRL